MNPAYIDENCTELELKEIVCLKGLLQYNIDATGGLLQKPSLDINLVVRNGEGLVVGGIMCETYLMCLDIDVLWMDKAYRGQGFGHQLISRAENIAREAGCLFAHTCTYSFQSPEFYKRQGYEIYAVMDGFPNDIKLYRLKKNL